MQQARERLAAIQADLDQRVAQLRTVQDPLLAARARLIALENRFHLASGALAANLGASYEGGKPDLTSVVLESHGFGDLLERVSFMARPGPLDHRLRQRRPCLDDRGGLAL